MANAISVYLSGRKMQIAVGQPTKKRLSKLYTVMLPTGVIQNGVVFDNKVFVDSLNNCWSRLALPRANVRLIINSAQMITFRQSIPDLPEKQRMKCIKNEFVEISSLTEPLFDYFILKKLRSEKMLDVVSVTCEAEYIKNIISLFSAAKIMVTSVNVSLSGACSYFNAVKDLRNQTFLMIYFDDNIYNCFMVVDGEYRYSMRSMFLFDAGSNEGSEEIQRRISSLQQYHSSEKITSPITAVYFAGTEAENIAFLSNAVTATFGLPAAALPSPDKLKISQEACVMLEDDKQTAGCGTVADYFYPIGDLLSGGI